VMIIDHFLCRRIDNEPNSVNESGSNTGQYVSLIVPEMSNRPPPGDRNKKGDDDKLAGALEQDVENLK